jgi:hypothetical protein
MSRLPQWLKRTGVLLLTAIASGAAAGSDADVAPPDGTIGYVMTNLFWSVYQTPDGREECPHGFNDGPREQFEALYGDGRGASVEDTQLRQELETWFPTTEPDGFTFHEIEGTLSYGLDLDGQVGPNDFTHPDGTPGIDNEVYRAVGCIIGFRGPDGVEVIFQDKAIADRRYNRTMIELTGVDSLRNDDEVTLTIYRGLDRLLTDATGMRVMAGGSQRVDMRWGADLVRTTTARIVDGVLTSGAEGLIAGYADVDTYYKQLIRNDSTHHLSNGQISGISLYKAMRRLADAYPDPETGAMTAISTALDVRMAQVFIVHADDEAAGRKPVTR